jgi:hypothetical protein
MARMLHLDHGRDAFGCAAAHDFNLPLHLHRHSSELTRVGGNRAAVPNPISMLRGRR